MSYCINPTCSQPDDPANINNRLCRHCGSELLLQGRYQVMRLLSDKSGFGTVYEAYQGTVPKILKVLKLKHNHNPRVVQLFQQEAEVLSQLNHPGIPQVESDGYFQFFPRGSTEGLHCIIMEKIDGLNLKQWMKQQGNHPISEDQALDWLTQVTEILHKVHQKNYFHRDIKPENIMIRSTGQLVLIDFGTARELTYTYLAEVGGGGNVTKISSAGYTPPEQEKGHGIPQSDFYALGRTFVYLLTGIEANDRKIYDPLTDQLTWRDRNSYISENLAHLLDKLMAHTAGKRPKNTQEILDRLEKIHHESSGANLATHIDTNTASQSSGMKPISLLPTLRQVKLKKRFLIVGISCAVTLGIGLAGYGIWIYQEYNPKIIQVAHNRQGEGSYVNYLVFSPDGKKIISSSADKKMRIWDLTNGQEINTVIKHSLPINYFAIGPDWHTVAMGGSHNTIEIWNWENGKLITTLAGHTGEVNFLVITPDNNNLISASADNTIKVWDLDTDKAIKTLTGHSSYVNYVILSPDGKKIISASADKTIKIWDFQTGTKLNTLSGHTSYVNYLAINPDGTKLVSSSADKTIKIWDFETGKALKTLTGHSAPVKPIAISPDGRKLVSGSADGIVKIWDLNTYREIRTLRGHSSSINAVAISPDGKKVVTASADGTIRVWHMPE
ncbi:MAG TPA: protein kinase [Cyanobacteria bacterium UBA11149]|nr:protein kinase [Cyanobacteria bacterium UBA11367]HBE59954.1 protein kinase [Cyanobacteria bacterium UBA11366]HBK63714.1 protein kinase [Cyanobacteria bacterium UBA11166]HBR77122.1 protein kinase [Cyanobacteria bacterium UBA11159]HBS67723.1 protein kinase [Cyanobacteria bacterium UBA11153]HBW90616.1 protein kinase [Cyanobacteria bacterium UBA11149]HCA93666.1 protein kinase [Cyanobacteria bacterium UBA9226]